MPSTPPMTTTTERRRWWPPVLSLRMRLLGWALLLLAVASVGSVLAVRQVLLNQQENRVTADLEQEVAEFRLLAGGRDPATGEPFGADVARLADTYLERNTPQEGESVLLFVDGEFHGGSAEPPYDLSTEQELVDRWTSLADSAHGRRDETPAGALRWLAVPVTVEDETRGHMVVAQFTGERRADIERAVQLMAFACLLVIVVVAAGGYLAMGRALRPLRTVTETARAIEERDLSRRIEVAGGDEVARLARTFNAMVARLQRAFATQQDFLRDVGHELRTPITIVRGHIELLGDDPTERRETVALVTDELDRMSRMVDDLTVLARAQRPDFLRTTVVDIPAMVQDVYAKATALGARDWQLGTVAPTVLLADWQRLTQALMQLVQNAVQCTTEGDRITLMAEVRGDRLALAVADTGPGIAPEDQQRIFARFARGRTAGAGGSGLGLAIVAAIAASHGGDVTVDSAPDAGATFTLTLPLEAQPGEGQPPDTPAAGGAAAGGEAGEEGGARP